MTICRQAPLIVLFGLIALMSAACTSTPLPAIPASSDAPILVPGMSDSNALTASLACRGNTTIIAPRLHTGDQVRLPCGVADSVRIFPVPEIALPLAPSPDGTYISGIAVIVFRGATTLSALGESKTLTLSFVVPVNFASHPLAIFYWNPTHNAGLGGWVQVPMSTTNGRAEATLGYTGTFALVAR